MNATPAHSPRSDLSATTLGGAAAFNVSLALLGISIGLATLALMLGVVPVGSSTQSFFAAIPALACGSFVCIALSQRSSRPGRSSVQHAAHRGVLATVTPKAPIAGKGRRAA
ncbi:MAG: hypothetical protein KF864_12040 [Phycisphaeraceae bacterium]|nr:hypothetical protein [Phycisphaeraceae bacterium]